MNTNNFKIQHTFYTYFTLNKHLELNEKKIVWGSMNALVLP